MLFVLLFVWFSVVPGDVAVALFCRFDLLRVLTCVSEVSVRAVCTACVTGMWVCICVRLGLLVARVRALHLMYVVCECCVVA